MINYFKNEILQSQHLNLLDCFVLFELVFDLIFLVLTAFSHVNLIQYGTHYLTTYSTAFKVLAVISPIRLYYLLGGFKSKATRFMISVGYALLFYGLIYLIYRKIGG